VLDINAELANQVIKVSGVASAMGNRITRKSELSDNTFYLHHERQRKIVESFQRIAEYSADIAEMVINMKATEIKDSLSGDAQVLEQA
jgi:Tfp pilus assembly protein PilO